MDREQYDEVVEASVMDEPSPSPQVPPHGKPHTKTLLLRFEGQGDAHLQSGCIDCVARKAAEPGEVVIWCLDCFGVDLLTIKTVATFELLCHLHLLALTTKSSTYNFYHALKKLTNNMGINVPNSRYRALQRMCLQWRHLTMLKRAGRGHHESGVEGTKEGELAVPCLTCPHDGISLPLNSQSMPNQFLYVLRLAMDANFHLKQQLVSSYSSNPGMGTGLAYMVKRGPYEVYVLSKASQGDISTCMGFTALAKANNKFSKGLQYTGVAAVLCARGEMLMPCSVGNLVKGERCVAGFNRLSPELTLFLRYLNMDYIIGSMLRFYQLILILTSYDIICQWFKNLSKQHAEWPVELQLPSTTVITPAIPKLHEPAHKEIHNELLLNHIVGSGLTDGECPERIWAGHNALGNSTKTMGPGMQQDTLDDHFGFWNWLKYNSMGKTLMRKYKGAVKLRNLQVEAHRGFTASMPLEKVNRWRETCEAWEADNHYLRKAVSPFVSDAVCIMEAKVWKELAKEKTTHMSNGGAFLHSTSASGFLVLGLELEELQQQIFKLAKTGVQPLTSTQGATLSEQRNSLRAKLRSWEQLRGVYMPGLLQFLEDQSQRDEGAAIEDSQKPEQTELWLPSQLPGARLQTTINRAHERAQGFAQKYQVAQEQKLLLSRVGEWERTLCPLADSDIRAYTDPSRLKRGPGRPGTIEDDPATLPPTPHEDQEPEDPEEGDVDMDVDEIRNRRDGTGATCKEFSWIWTTGSTTSKLDDDDLLCSEWAKSRARSNHALEEVLLLQEEMGRALDFLQWKGRWWRDRTSAWGVLDQELAEGLKVYALEQASLQEWMALSFRQAFRTPLEDGIAELYLRLAAISSTVKTPEPELEDDDEEEYKDDDSREVYSAEDDLED
ncbi:hypothetical protein DXG01_004049 [Tephrocybe rancida]|nr:hypothetical protein DXG01_004049 [Tephrocybe rancida]